VAGDPSIGRGRGRSLDHRPRGGCSTRRGLGGKPTTFGEATSSMELIQMSARYVCSDRERRYRSPRLGYGLGAHEVFVRGPPYATRRATRAPAG
jgi:hypothetical protein